MKNWQLRWFVLRTEALYFYKDQDESKAQVLQNSTYEALTSCHLLQGCSVIFHCIPPETSEPTS